MSDVIGDFPRHGQKLEVRDVLAEALMLAANNLGALAAAINRLAATQEVVVGSKPPVNWGVATYAEKPDIQTQELRELEARRRSGFDSQMPKTTDGRS